jgi:hypothetical protein
MTYEEKRNHFQICKQKGDVMAVVKFCDGVASYATIIKALNTPGKYKSKKQQQIIDVAYQFVNSRARGVVYDHSVLEA